MNTLGSPILSVHRRHTKVSGVALSPVEPAENWAETFPAGEREAFFTVLGQTTKEREEFYAAFRGGSGVVSLLRDHHAWHQVGPLRALQNGLRAAWVPPDCKEGLPDWWPPPSGNWGLLWGLGAVSNFAVDGQLRFQVDVPFSLLHDLYRAIWEIRFAIREGREALGLVQAVGTWMLGESLSAEDHGHLAAVNIQRQVSSPNEKIDLVCGLLLMAAQNGLVERFFLGFDNIEAATRPNLKELFMVLQGVDRWTTVEEQPLGILLGWNGDGASLARTNTRFADYIVRGMA